MPPEERPPYFTRVLSPPADARAVNAVRHGLRASHPVVLAVETEEDWEVFRASVVGSLRAAGGVQELLAERVASSMWRLRRVQVYESGALARRAGEVGELGMAVDSGMMLSDELVERVTRYEAHLSRELYRALAALVQLREVEAGG